MISITNVLLILLIHTVADFFFQSRKMAENKGKSVYWLSVHVLIYSVVTTLGWLLFTTSPTVLFAVINITVVTHWCTDFVTSRLSGYFYLKDNLYGFFSTIGVDQLIHATTLLLTYKYLIN